MAISIILLYNAHVLPGKLHYQSKISGPLLERIDLQIGVAPVDAKTLFRSRHPTKLDNQSSEVLREGVLQARQRQMERFNATGLNEQIMLNSMMSSAQIKALVKLDGPCKKVTSTHYR